MKILILFFLLKSTSSLAFALKISGPEKVGVDPAKLQKAIDFAFTDITGQVRTEGLILYKDGVIFAEKYAHGFANDRPHRIWSITKSFTGAIIGTAIEDGLFKLNDPAFLYYPLLNQSEKHQKITIKNLLGMNSGLEWNESYTNPFTSDVIKMLYGREMHNMADFAAAKPLVAKVGEKFNYSSGTSNLLMKLLSSALLIKRKKGQTYYNEYPWEKLFLPLGIKSATWEQDKSGTFVGSSYLFMTLRDLLRFGIFYLNKGTIPNSDEGIKILGKDFVKYSTVPVKAIPDGKFGYGAQWWLNDKGDGTFAYPFLPKGTYFGRGHNGQILMVIPEWSFVMARIAHDGSPGINRNRFYRLLKEAVGRP